MRIRIEWSKAKIIKLNHEEFNAKVDWLRENGNEIKRIAGKKTGLRFWIKKNTFHIDEKIGSSMIYCSYCEDGKAVIYISFMDETKNDRAKSDKKENSGTKSYFHIQEQVKEKTDKSFYKTYGFTNKKGEQEEWAKFVPGNFVYVDPRYKERALKHIYKADVSSAYPYELCGKIPTRNGEKIVQGRVAPTEEYPFCYYTKSHAISVYGEFDSMDYADRLYRGKGKKRQLVIDSSIKPEDDETIMMKAADYQLDDIMQELYDKKGEDPNVKLIMNSFIGAMHSWEIPSYIVYKMNASHIASIALTRHNIRMYKLWDALKAEGNHPFMAMTDCICWYGKPSATTTKEKKLGAFLSEYEDVDFCVAACGVYAIQDPITKEMAVIKHQGTDARRVEGITFKKTTDILKLGNMFMDTVSRKNGKFVIKTVVRW